MKLCPQCNKQCLNSVNVCECGYSFSDDSPPPAVVSPQRSGFLAKTGTFALGLLLFLTLSLIVGFAAGLGSRIGYFVGLAVGFIPLVVATKKHELLGMFGLYCCSIAGGIAGLIGALPTAAVFWLIISMVKKKSG
jgi:hypothetical protein